MPTPSKIELAPRPKTPCFSQWDSDTKTINSIPRLRLRQDSAARQEEISETAGKWISAAVDLSPGDFRPG